MNKFLLSIFVCLSLFGCKKLWAQGNAVQGEKKSQSCIVCHGKDGISPNELWPNLAGQKEAYLILQLKAFRQGERKNEIMNPLSQTLTDQDIEDISSYYSQLKSGDSK